MNQLRNWLLMGWLVASLACSADQLTMGSEKKDGGVDLPAGPAALAADSTPLVFGTVALGLSSVRSLTISNTGQSASGALSLNSSSEAFVIRTGGNGDCVSDQTLAAGASCTVAIVFAPSASDARSGTLTYSASPGGSGSIALSGSGKPGRLSVLAGVPSGQGTADGIGSAARFSHPSGVVIDPAGTLFVADRRGFIRKITPAGVVTTVALHGDYSDRLAWDTTGMLPWGSLALDPSGNLYLSDRSNALIWKIAPGGTATLFAGPTTAPGAPDGTGFASLFDEPAGLVADDKGNIFLADSDNHAIRRITPDGVVTTYAGTVGVSGNEDGPVADAKFDSPNAVTIDTSGNLFVGSRSSAGIRKISPAGVVTTIATKEVHSILAIAVDGAGNLFITDSGSEAIHRISSTGVESVFAGEPDSRGGVDGTGAVARFQFPTGMAIDASDNLYVVDRGNNAIRRITPAGVVTTFAGALNSPGSDDGPGDKARFRLTDNVSTDDNVGMAWDGAGNLFVADRYNHTIRKILPAGVVTTLAGTPGVSGSRDGNGAQAQFSVPMGVAADNAGNIYVADTGNFTIRKITPTGMVATLAGSPGSVGTEDGQGAAARFYQPTGIAVDSAGNVFVSDTNATIRRITPTGVVTTPFGMAGDIRIVDGVGTSARFRQPEGLTMDRAGNLYVADKQGNAIRKITPTGEVTTLAGSGEVEQGSVDGTGAAARFATPGGVAADGAGNIFVADVGNHAIRKITPAGVVSTFAGVSSFATQGNFIGPLPASLFRPAGVAINPATGLMAIALVDAILTIGP
jgi:sugar lactone lactonase YvrE